ncbi:MAG: DUF1003 domain-containing protein [Anaerolineae bacterium]|nr:DUF1003 domain-containing protein [Anaerolineae bacterium]
MKQVSFPKPFTHNHGPVQDVNEVFREQMTVGQRAADWIARFVGSWQFIIGQSIILVIWIVLNSVAWVFKWDPYPFILMNLVLSTQAAFTAPIIMMSQGRQAARDRLESHNDYLINVKSEQEIRAILDHLVAQDEALKVIYEMVHELKQRQDGEQK